ncbi:DUF4190 domain-containing protein [Streptomyces sp. NPDC048659]|uniref:DUF4190 domain-containing protein n=1 Tax=Streptomyces sp. NPDC048659 TaxID=3155489 RepID=UPI00341D4266
MTMPTYPPGQQPWDQQGTQPPAQPRNGLGVSALVLGIVGLIFAIIPFLFWLGGILGLLALIFGIVGMSRAGKGLATNKGQAITGLVLGALSIVVSIVWTIAIAMAVNDVVSEEKILQVEAEPSASASAKPGTAATPGADTTPDAPADKAPGALKFGETFAYDDGVKVTISKPRAHKPDAFAAGYTKGNKAFQVTITIVNGGKTPLDVAIALPNAKGADGSAAEMVFDGSNATKPFQGKVLPGKQAKADFTFAMAPAAAGELQVELAPTILEHEAAIWSGPTS